MRERKETGSHLLLIWRSATCLYWEAMRSEHNELKLKHVTSLSRLCVSSRHPRIIATKRPSPLTQCDGFWKTTILVQLFETKGMSPNSASQVAGTISETR